MTVRSLHSLPARNMLRVVKQNKKLSIVMSILMIISIPLIMVPTLWEAIADSHENMHSYHSTELYMGVGAFCLAVTVFMGMFIAIFSLRELYKKSQVDMLYALPLTGKQRFFSDVLGGFCIYIFPYIISVILGWIAIGCMCWFIYPDDPGAHSSMIHSILRYYSMGTSGLLVLMLFYYALCTFITVCCGTMFECIYTNILLNLLIPGTIAAILGMISSHVDLSFDYMWQIIGYMSPAGGLIYLIYLMDEGGSFSEYCSWSTLRATETHSHDMLPSYFRWIVIILVLAAACLVLAWQLYIRRKAEHVGKPFVYVAAYYVMLTLLTMLILCLLDFNVIGPVLLFAAIVYFVCEVIRKRGFKKFWLSIITFVVTVAATVGIFAVAVKTDCFGRENYVPAAATITSVEVQYDANCSADFEFTDRDVISKVTAFHKSLMERRKDEPNSRMAVNKALTDKFLYRVDYSSYNGYSDEDPYTLTSMAPNNYYDDYDYESDRSLFGDNDSKEATRRYGSYAEFFSLRLTYYTLAGTVIHRDLTINADELAELRLILNDSDLYAATSGKTLNKLITENVGLYENGEYNVPDVFRLSIQKSLGKQTRAVSGGSASIAQLAAAYERDLRNMSAEQRRTAPLYCTFSEDNNSVFKVYEGYNETIALLKSWGFRDFTVPERYDFVDGDNAASSQARNQSVLSLRIYAPDQWSTDSLKYPNSSVSYSNNTYVNSDFNGKNPAYKDNLILMDAVKVNDYYPELIALLDAAQDEYISEEPCYCILVNGERYIIPPAHNDLVQAVLDKGSDYGSTAIEDYFNEHYSEIYPQYSTTAGDDVDITAYDEYDDQGNYLGNSYLDAAEDTASGNVSDGNAEETSEAAEPIEAVTDAEAEPTYDSANDVVNSAF